MINSIMQGHCLCNAVQYAVEGEPLWCAHCHCADCRRHTGSAVATFVAVKKDEFTLTAGEFGRIESSPGVYRSFCATCGTPMAYERNDLPGELHLYLGTLEHPAACYTPCQLSTPTGCSILADQLFCRGSHGQVCQWPISRKGSILLWYFESQRLAPCADEIFAA
jgi:hypothetical protein